MGPVGIPPQGWTCTQENQCGSGNAQGSQDALTQMRGLLMSSTVRVGVCVNATLDQKPADAMLEKCVAMLPEGAAFLSYGTLSRGPGLLESLAKSVAGPFFCEFPELF